MRAKPYLGGFLPPPRPTAAITTTAVQFYQGRPGWIAQPKIDGSYLEVEIQSDGVRCYNRHGEPSKKWHPSPKVIAELQAYFGPVNPCLLCAELLSKNEFKDILIFHDAVAWLGRDIQGAEYRNRLALLALRLGLDDGWDAPESTGLWNDATGHLKLIKSFDSPFPDLWTSKLWFCEGLVLKNQTAPATHKSWCCKVRKPSRRYSF